MSGNGRNGRNFSLQGQKFSHFRPTSFLPIRYLNGTNKRTNGNPIYRTNLHCENAKSASAISVSLSLQKLKHAHISLNNKCGSVELNNKIACFNLDTQSAQQPTLFQVFGLWSMRSNQGRVQLPSNTESWVSQQIVWSNFLNCLRIWAHYCQLLYVLLNIWWFETSPNYKLCLYLSIYSDMISFNIV